MPPRRATRALDHIPVHQNRTPLRKTDEDFRLSEILARL
jgi:hypothetical protein